MNQKKKTVLIVEDEKMLANAIKKKLEKNDFDVLVANDGQEGLKTFLEKHPDLVLLDIILPKLDGMSVLEELRKDDWGSEVPVIVLSNLSRAQTIDETREQGVTNYLIKTDWKLDEVIKKVKYELGII